MAGREDACTYNDADFMAVAFSIVNRQSLGREAWDTFVADCHEAWLHHRWALQEAILTWPGHEPEGLAVVDDKDRVVAVWPLRVARGRLFKLLNDVTLDSLGGPAVAADLGQKRRSAVVELMREELIHRARRHQANVINVALSPMIPVLRGEACPRVNPLVHWGFTNTATQTWVVDLRPGPDAVWEGMEGRARTAIRKAEKEGVAVRPADRPGDLDVYYALHVATYTRTGVPPHPRAYFEAIFGNFAAHGLAGIFFAEQHGEVIAAANFALDKQAGWYWTGASGEAGLRTGAGSLLQWHGMQWLMDQGAQWCDTGEAIPGARSGKLKGLNDFKKSFGGTLTPFFKGTLSLASPGWKMVQAVHGVLRPGAGGGEP